MRVKILGCGGSAGVPHIGGADGRGDWGACNPAELRNIRTRSSIAIETDTATLLVDTSPDLRAQLLACAVARVDAILFTHAHADHIMGLDEVRLLNRIAGKPLPAYGTAATLDEITRRFDYAFRPWTGTYFFRPALVQHAIEAGDTVETTGLTLDSFEQDHEVMRTLGFRIGPFAYSTDLVRLSDAALDKLAGVDTWLVGCFQRAPHTTHANLKQVLAWRDRIGARRTILTHMGADMDWGWMTKNLPAGVEPAHDGMVLDFAAAA